MDLDDFAKGAVASVLIGQVNAKTGFAYKAAWLIAALAAVGVVLIDNWLRWLAVLVVLLGLAALLFVFVTKRFATGLINRLAPPTDVSLSREQFDTAIAEADIPTSPFGFLRFTWRLRNGIGPEFERLAAVVARFKEQLG